MPTVNNSLEEVQILESDTKQFEYKKSFRHMLTAIDEHQVPHGFYQAVQQDKNSTSDSGTNHISDYKLCNLPEHIFGGFIKSEFDTE